MTAPQVIVGLGELLWDLLPEGKQLGGAPANFTVMAARLGSRAVIASRLGDDALGREARAYLSGMPADIALIQTDPEHETGSVAVTLSHGQAEYVIHQPVAWDFLALTPEWRALAARADAVCFGSLAQRGAVSRETIHGFLAATRKQCVRVFDVNLRKPHYSSEVLKGSLELATILKLNDLEMPLVLGLLGLPSAGTSSGTDAATLLAGARKLLEAFPMEMVCITMGEHGSLLVTRRESHRHPGVPTRLADTVGAGDAFTAALTHYYLQGAPLAVLNEAGNRWGAWVASQHGAMPALPESTLRANEAAIEAAR
jgi:fructokinase